MPLHPLRSVLFMPASNARAVAKAASLPTDAIVFDLEDAVAQEAKDAARAGAIKALSGAVRPGQARIVRINGLETGWAKADIAALAPLAPDALLIPKVESAAQLAQARQVAGRALPLWAMIETPLGVINLNEIACDGVGLGLRVLMAGANDLTKELKARRDPLRTGLVPHLARLVAAARAYGLRPIDAVYNSYKDAKGFTAECGQGRVLGFDGKSLIHPSQIEAANAAFSPSKDEVAWAKGVVKAYEASKSGAVAYEGEMVERLHLEEARAILSFRTMERRRPE